MLEPSCSAARMWRSMLAAGAPSVGRALGVTFGSAAASAGGSHSWVTATTRSPAPAADRISVALGRRPGNVLEMGGRAADHRAEADDGVATAALGKLARCDRDLEGAGDPDDGDVRRRRAVPHQRVDSALEQTLRHDVVEASHHDA